MRNPSLTFYPTRLDVRILEPETPEKMTEQAGAFRDMTGACVQVDACVGVTVWDFWDPVSISHCHLFPPPYLPLTSCQIVLLYFHLNHTNNQ